MPHQSWKMPNGIREKLKRVLVVGEQRGTRFAFRGARLEEHDVLFNTERERSVKIVTLGFFLAQGANWDFGTGHIQDL